MRRGIRLESRRWSLPRTRSRPSEGEARLRVIARQRSTLNAAREIAPAKLNLALHVRGRLPDGRHAIETIFAFCTDGDRLSAEEADTLSLEIIGLFAGDLGEADNLVSEPLEHRRRAAGVEKGAAITLEKRLPVASGTGGGICGRSGCVAIADVDVEDHPDHAEEVAPKLGSDVPACLLSLPARGEGAGNDLSLLDLADFSGMPALLINPRVALPTGDVFSRWDGVDHGPLGDWREGRNDLEGPAIASVPQIETVHAWLSVAARCRVGADVRVGSDLFRLIRFRSDEGLGGGPGAA